MKIVRKILFYLSLAAGVVVLSVTLSVLLFKDKVIAQFIREANKQLSTPVKVGKIDVSVWRHFPSLSIVMTDVYIEDSHEGQYPLLTARELSFHLNLFDTWQGTYLVQGLQLIDSETNLKVNTRGENNYTIAKSSGTDAQGSVKFALHNVRLINTVVHYNDQSINQQHTYTSQSLKASIDTDDDIYVIKADGDLTTTKLIIDGTSYLTGKNFEIASDLIYDDGKKILTINPSTLNLRNSRFGVSGTYAWRDTNTIDIRVEGEDTDIQTLVSLLPEATAGNLAQYRSKGDVYFKAALQGEISKARNPAMTIDFGCTNATVYHPAYKSRIEGARLEGTFTTADVTRTEVARLTLKNVSGRLNEEPFSGNLLIQNLKSPDVTCDFKGRIDAAALLGFYPIDDVRSATGSLLANVMFRGKIDLLKKRSTAQKVTTQGTIDLHQIGFSFGTDNVRVDGLNGNMQFSNNDLALSNVSGKLGNSDFTLNGFFKNVITFLLFDNQPIGIETDLKSRFLDVDQLFAIAFGNPSSDKSQEYAFSISRNINLNFNCNVEALRYKRFHAQRLQGDLLVKNEMAVSRNINFRSMGGLMNFSGIVDSHNPKAIEVVSTFKVKDIYLDSIFYVFENFQQDFIQDKHLKGQTSADVNLEMVLNPNLRLFQETLVGDITASIRNGELNNFEPMKKLNRFLNDEGLSHMRFSELKNDIHIENKTIYIPQMEIRTNVTTVRFSGTHTFDQRIDYHVVAPLRNNRNINYQEAKGALEEDGSGQSKLFLKITGTTDNYRVTYDTEAVKKKIASDLKNEVKELQDAFRNKGTKQKKEVELEQDEYFDWDESAPN